MSVYKNLCIALHIELQGFDTLKRIASFEFLQIFGDVM